MRIWIGVGVFLGVLIIAFAFFVFRITEGPVTPTVSEPAVTIISDVRNVADTYKKGVHTVHGTVTVPTACTEIEANASVDSESSSTPVIRVDLSAESDTGTCLMLPTNKTFSVQATLTGSAPIAVYVNGVLATTTP